MAILGNQIKSKSRVVEHGEVFTAEAEVNAMVDLVKEEIQKIGSTVLEPACGDGNFLVKILETKLDTVERLSCNSDEFEIYSSLAFSSIYGVDIQMDNVKESSARLFQYFESRFFKRYNKHPSYKCRQAIKFILDKNIQCGDTLTALNYLHTDLIISDWKLTDNQQFIRRDISYKYIIGGDNTHYIKTFKYNWFAERHTTEWMAIQYV